MTAHPITRRRLLASGIATSIAGGAAWLSTVDDAEASASVDLNSLDLADSEYASPDGTPHAPHLLVNGTFQYDVSGSPRRAEEWVVFVHVGSTSGGEELANITRGTAAMNARQADFDVRVDLTKTDLYKSADFHATETGQITEHLIPVRVVFEVRDAHAEPIVSAEATDTIGLTVRNTATGEQVIASFNATGGVAWQENASDDPPTLTDS